MSKKSKTVVILGITGRLGPALARRFEGWEIRGLSRRAPFPDEGVPEQCQFYLGDRTDEKLLRQMLEGADAVIDCIGFHPNDGQSLVDALSTLTKAPSHLIFMSSIAECGRHQIGCSEQETHQPEGDDGKAKMALRKFYQAKFPGKTHSLILPRLVAETDHHRREQSYIESASSGPALVAGTGDQRQIMAPVSGVAEVAYRLAESPESLKSTLLNVGPPTPLSVREAVASIIKGAGLTAIVRKHPDPKWRGPHGGGTEPLDTSLLQKTFPGIQWPASEKTFEKLGAWLAKNPNQSRPKPLLKPKEKSFVGHGVVDVHRLRTDLQLENPEPALTEVANWLTPAFYIDTGRPCNAACLYCAVPPHLDTQGFSPLEQLRKQIAVGKQAGNSRAILIGGEPTIHPELQSVFADLRTSDFAPGHVVMTNGQKLADKSFVQNLFKEGVRTVHLSIDTADPLVYDQIARTPGRSEKQWLAFENVLAEEGLNLYIYTCVTKLNAAGIGALFEKIRMRSDALSKPSPPVICAFLKPIGDGLTHRGTLLQSFAERTSTARNILQEAQSNGINVGFRNLQACLAPELVPYLVDYYIEDASVNLRTGESEGYAHGSYWRRVDACEECGHNQVCPGVYFDDPLKEANTLFKSLKREGLG